MAKEKATKEQELDGAERTAVLLLSLGEDAAAKVMRHLDPREVQKIGTAMSSLRNISSTQVDAVLAQFLQGVELQTNIGIGSDDYLRRVLTEALGEDKGGQVIDRIVRGGASRGIETLKWMDPRAVADSIRLEHPQIIAIIFAHLDADHAAAVMSHLSPVLVPDILMRVAALESIQPEALRELDQMLEKQFSGKSSMRAAGVGGIKAASEIMNFMESSLEANAMKEIEAADAELAQKIQDSMFVFENLASLDDRSIQTLLREIQTEELVVALKGADADLRDIFVRNMSRRAGESFIEDLESRGPVRLSEVEAMQKSIVATTRRLADEGQISISSGGADDFV